MSAGNIQLTWKNTWFFPQHSVPSWQPVLNCSIVYTNKVIRTPHRQKGKCLALYKCFGTFAAYAETAASVAYCTSHAGTPRAPPSYGVLLRSTFWPSTQYSVAHQSHVRLHWVSSSWFLSALQVRECIQQETKTRGVYTSAGGTLTHFLFFDAV